MGQIYVYSRFEILRVTNSYKSSLVFIISGEYFIDELQTHPYV